MWQGEASNVNKWLADNLLQNTFLIYVLLDQFLSSFGRSVEADCQYFIQKLPEILQLRFTHRSKVQVLHLSVKSLQYI